ncbi:hypothetical protein B0J17DRAFT_403182 [Rhizoctonia solani]|nr:hypothetical protein B0J17DRAFT_403182 [Rhizoctonia solani]
MLEKTLESYLESRSEFEPSVASHLDPNHVVSRIEERLPPFDTCITQSLNSARLSMPYLRKNPGSSIHRLPDEILVIIFHFVIHHHEIEQPVQLSFHRTVKATYRKLYTLLIVCSKWQQIGISHSSFWSLVPMINHWGRKAMLETIDLILERAAGSKLYVAATLTNENNRRNSVLDTLDGFGSRLGAITLASGSQPLL